MIYLVKCGLFAPQKHTLQMLTFLNDSPKVGKINSWIITIYKDKYLYIIQQANKQTYITNYKNNGNNAGKLDQRELNQIDITFYYVLYFVSDQIPIYQLEGKFTSEFLQQIASPFNL